MEKKKKFFRVSVCVYIVIYALSCLYGALVPSSGNSFHRGATIYYPQDGSQLGNTFNINGSVYAKTGIKQANVIFDNGNDKVTVPIETEKITYDGKVLETLSTFKKDVEVPDGVYKMYAEIVEIDGTATTFPEREISVSHDAIADSFVMFGKQHLVTLSIIIAFYILVFTLFKNKKRSYTFFAVLCAALVMIGDIISRIWLIQNGTFRASYDMALHMCDMSGILLPILLFMKPGKPRDIIYNLMFIWGLGGALMALLTPEMGGYTFPSYYYFNFFIKHSMLIFGVLIATFFYGMRPSLKKLGWVMIISSIIIVIIFGINQLLRYIPPFEPGNYMFISYPPTGGSLLDTLVLIFGPSPYYIIGMEILGAAIYVLLYLPFYIIDKKAKKVRSKKMKKIDAIDYSAEILDAFKSGGVFLNSKLGDEINSMVMGWGSMSVYWGKPVLVAPVRLSRYTHDMIEKSGVFTVSIPAKGTLRKELGICGSKSRRDVDKFETCGFTALDGTVVDCPVIGEAMLHLECKVLAQTLLNGCEMDSEVIDKWYGGDSENGDFHDLFFGEIVDAYIIE